MPVGLGVGLGLGQRGSVAVTPPGFASAAVGAVNAYTVVVTFSEGVASAGGDYGAGVTITVGGVAATITSATRQADHAVVRYELGSVVLYGQAVTWAYSAAAGDIASEASGAALDDVAAETVTSTVADLRIFLDNFTGTGALADHTPDLAPGGAAWAVTSATTFSALAGGKLPGNDAAHVTAVCNLGVADVDVRASIYCGGTTYGAGVVLRSNADGTNRFVCYLDFQNRLVQLMQYTTKTASTDVQVSKVYTPGTTYNLRVLARGNSFQVWLDGTLMISHLNANYIANTYHGAGAYVWSSTATMDWLEVSTVAATVVEGVFGDSISYQGSTDITGYYPGGVAFLYNHAANGADTGYLAQQVTAAQGDTDVDFYINNMGRNDVWSATSKANYKAAMQQLASDHPAATLYCMGVIPENNDTSRIAKNVDIAAVASELGLTYWNTDGWIDPTPGVDTTDGVHPNAAGMAKIRARIKALLP